MAKTKKKQSGGRKAAGRRRKKSGGDRVMSFFVGFLFVLLILVGVAISFDYILFAFNRTPIFALTDEAGETVEHIGLIYVVTETSPKLTWEWIWQKL